MKTQKPNIHIGKRAICITAPFLLLAANCCFGAGWTGADDFSAGILATNWTITQMSQGQMTVVGTNGHASFLVPISTTNEQNAYLVWRGTPTAAEDWTVEIHGHNSAPYSSQGGSALQLAVVDTASLGSVPEGFIVTRENSSNYGAIFGTTQWSGGGYSSRASVSSTVTNFGLRLVYHSATRQIEAWYDPTANGSGWTKLDTINLSDLSPSMTATDTFTFAILSDTYYGPISEGDIWADDFQLASEPSGWRWSQRVASASFWPEEPNVGLALDSSDNCYVTGWFDGTNDFGGVTLTNQSAGGSDIFVAKYDASGALQWAQRAGGTSNNYGRGVGTDANGNVYVAGTYQGPANFNGVNLPATSGEQFFLAKYNNAGAVQWVQSSTGGSDQNIGIGLAVDGAGNSYALAVMDHSATSLSFGSKTVTTANYGHTLLILVKYDDTGTAQWAQLFDSSQETYGSKVAVDAAGNVYVRAMFDSDMEIGTSNFVGSAGTKNMFVAKFNSAGTLIWVQQPQGSGGEGGVAVDPAGNVYVSGYFTNTLNFGGGIGLTNIANASAPFGDAFIAKYNSVGAIQWAQPAGGTNGGFYWDLVLDAQTNIYAAGFLGLDAAVTKYSPAGSLEWSYSASGPPASPVSSGVAKCAVDSVGNCYLAGFYQGTTIFGANTLQPQEAWNVFLAEVSAQSQDLFYDNFRQFAEGADITSTNYTPASGPQSASVLTRIDNGSPTITVTNLLGNTWAFFDNSLLYSKDDYRGYLSSIQTGQSLQITWKMWIQATNSGTEGFLLSVPTDDPVNNYNPPLVFFDNGSIVALTNGTPSTTPENVIGNWGSLAGTVMTNTLVLNYPAGTFTYALNGQTLATLPLGPYFTNVVDSITFTALERDPGALGNRFAIADVEVAAAIASNPAPAIQFTVSPTNGVAPLTVQFNSPNVDSLGNSITSWNWNFGDGAGADTQNPSHTYINSGTFNPSLVATNSQGIAVVGSGPQITILAATSPTNFTYITNNNTISIEGYVGTNSMVVIPETINDYPVTSIGAGAFSQLDYLMNVTIPNSVTSIGANAFNDCISLANMTIPSSVTNIGDSAFNSCFRMAAINVDPGNPAYSSINGVLFNHSLNVLIQYPAGNSAAAYLIPNGVTNIMAMAFSACSSLAEVTIPNSVTSIGVNAFFDCSLTNVMIPDSVTSIGTVAFDADSALTSIIVDPSNAFYSSVNGVLLNKNASALIEYPGGLTGGYTVPNSVASIGDAAFWGCSGVTSVTVPQSVTMIGQGVFAWCENLTNVELPNTIDNVGEQEFQDCVNMTRIAIPSSVTNIGYSAFYNCSSLTSITIPASVTSIGDYAFYECSSLTNITSSPGLISIGSYAFAYCTSLSSIIIPASVNHLGDYAGAYCYNLTAAYFLGNAPAANPTVLYDDPVTMYYLPGTTGWSGLPAVPWALPYPLILDSANGNTNLGVQNNQFGFTVSWATNLSIVVQASTNLANPVWIPVSTNALINGTFYFSDPTWTNYPGRFYRLTAP